MTNQDGNTEVLTEQDLMLVDNGYWAELYESLERLEKNSDFKKVILDGYFKDRAVTATSALASPRVRAEGTRALIMEDLVAISKLQHFFMMVKDLGSYDDTVDEDETSQVVEG